MNNDTIVWRMSPREAVPDLLLSREQGLPARGAFSVDEYRLKRGDVALGYLQSREDQQYNPPCILMLGEEKAVETFSWLRVYAGETWPLSQYVRLISERDWSEFVQPPSYGRRLREDVWASVVLGEVIAQGETDLGVEALPLSRAGACFSMAVARAVCSFGSDVATRECVGRLRQIEGDKRFVHRPVMVEELLPVWSLAGAASDAIGSDSVESTVMMVVNEVQHFMPDSARSLFAHVPINLREIPELASDSVEERVLAFNRLSGLLSQQNARDVKNPFAPVLLAGAALLVGRGTTHEFLLRRVSRQYPSASVWFGLLAAIAGPASWDPNWARAVKGIERQIRTRFAWAEASGFDLGWHEFRWMTSVFDSHEIFTSLPKLLPRVLSVEVVPGAVCQFRLAGSAAAEVETKPPVERPHERELVAALAQFVSLAGHAKQLLDDAQLPTQQSLDLISSDETVRPTKKRTRASSSKS